MLPELFKMNQEVADVLGFDTSFSTECPVLVITGDNAQGKSLFRRYVSVVCRENGVELIHLSQEGRGTEGFQRAWIYGDENSESTGCISAKTFKKGFNTSRNREKDHILLWDEPEIGMGEELQLGTSMWVKEELENWPEKLCGLVVLTHSRYFVSILAKIKGAKFYNMNGLGLDEWLNREILPISPIEVAERSYERFRKITKILNKLKKEKRKK